MIFVIILLIIFVLILCIFPTSISTNIKTQEKRKSILKRDNYKCRYCSSTNNLCVHHKYYLQYPNHKKVKPWNYPDDALITLCNKCHYRVHKNKQIKVYYKKYDTNS